MVILTRSNTHRHTVAADLAGEVFVLEKVTDETGVFLEPLRASEIAVVIRRAGYWISPRDVTLEEPPNRPGEYALRLESDVSTYGSIILRVRGVPSRDAREDDVAAALLEHVRRLNADVTATRQIINKLLEA